MKIKSNEQTQFTILSENITVGHRFLDKILPTQKQ